MTTEEKMAARDFLKVLSKVEIDMMRATLMLDLQKQIIQKSLNL